MRGGQRPKEKRDCPTCHQSVAIHTWSGELFSHICGTPEEVKAIKAAKKAERVAKGGGKCQDCGHFMDRHAGEMAGLVGRNWMGCNAPTGRYKPRCGCKHLRPANGGA
jgi:ssDNA-binding Zn-finger/Zn-ribbon topoisomerase 1